ncbi:21447_t:CDS:2 [Gigaspora rosea]|nr:21447_t:CDS:2 [Gigaspora rosea]
MEMREDGDSPRIIKEDYAKVKVIHNAKEVQILQFHPLFSEIIQMLEKISKTYHDAEYNKRTCGAIYDRVSVVEVTIRSLNFQWDEHKESFTHKNYTFLRKILKFDRYIDELDLVILVNVERPSSTYEDITLQLFKDNLDFYYVKSMHTLEFFNVPDVNELLNLQENSKVQPNCYLLFKRQIQLCVSNIGCISD